MKYIIALLFIIACKGGDKELSASKRSLIKISIDMRNIKIGGDFFRDSLIEELRVNRYTKEPNFPKDKIDEYKRASMRVFSSKWNEPYDIKKDRYLTLEKYLDYCKAHNLDPETYYKFFD